MNSIYPIIRFNSNTQFYNLTTINKVYTACEHSNLPLTLRTSVDDPVFYKLVPYQLEQPRPITSHCATNSRTSSYAYRQKSRGDFLLALTRKYDRSECLMEINIFYEVRTIIVEVECL